jgi:CRISPR-associated protein Cas2
MNIKEMKIILIFDLPTLTDENRRQYRYFHKKIIKLGYYMVQYSVYIKNITVQTKYDREIEKIKKNAPSQGNIRCFYITEHQYQQMHYITGQKTINEFYNNELRHIII